MEYVSCRKADGVTYELKDIYNYVYKLNTFENIHI